MGWQWSDPNYTSQLASPLQLCLFSCNSIYSPMTGAYMGRFSNPRHTDKINHELINHKFCYRLVGMVLRASTGSDQAGLQLQAANPLSPKEHRVHVYIDYIYVYNTPIHMGGCTAVHLSLCYKELKSLRCKLWHWQISECHFLL